jgi:tetratricopeptide (TPR) repeat protein
MKRVVPTLLAIFFGLILGNAGPALAQMDRGIVQMLNTGYDLLEQKKYDQAQRLYEETLRQHPGNPLALNNLAAIMSKKGQYDQALAYLRQALPRAEGFKVRVERVCDVDSVCTAYRLSDEVMGTEDLADLIKINMNMVGIAAASGRSK